MTDVLSHRDHKGVSRIYNLPNPLSADEPATKAYADALYGVLAWKATCRVATTVSVNISAPGSSIDGVTLSNGDRVLEKDNADATKRGIYIFNGAAVPMTRAADFDTTAEISGARIPIAEGSSNAGTTWALTTAAPTIGGALTFTNVQSATPDATTALAGKVTLANQSQVNSGATAPSNLVVTPETLNAWSNAKKIYTATFGDGAATSFTINHNLNSTSVTVRLRRVATGAFVEADVATSTVNAVTITCASAPSLNEYEVLVLG